MQKICRSLSGKGFHVELVGRLRNNSVALQAESFRQTRFKLLFNSGKLFYAEYNLRLFFYLLFAKADVFCAIDLDTLTAVYLAAKIKSTKISYDAHEYFTEVPEVVRRPLVKRVWQWVEKTFVPKLDLAFTVSPAIANLFTTQYQIPFHVVMNVPLLPETDSAAVKQDRTILYQGALNEGRGLEELIDAMQGINAKLLMAGEGDLSAQLRQQVRNKGLEKKVEFLGFVKPKELKTLTASVTIGVNLLRNTGLSYYYSLSNKFFDYIHADVPQVCIDFPEYRSINTQYEVAVLVESCQPEEISNAIERLLNDRELYSRLQKNCDVCRQQLNWQQEEKKMIALYNELLR